MKAANGSTIHYAAHGIVLAFGRASPDIAQPGVTPASEYLYARHGDGPWLRCSVRSRLKAQIVAGTAGSAEAALVALGCDLQTGAAVDVADRVF